MSRQVIELADVLQCLPEGEAIKMKQFLQVNEYAITDKTKKGMHPTDNRYLFDWKKMSKLSDEAQAYFKRVELGLEKRTHGWYQLDPADMGKKEKQFIGFADADVQSESARGGCESARGDPELEHFPVAGEMRAQK